MISPKFTKYSGKLKIKILIRISSKKFKRNLHKARLSKCEIVYVTFFAPNSNIHLMDVGCKKWNSRYFSTEVNTQVTLHLSPFIKKLRKTK